MDELTSSTLVPGETPQVPAVPQPEVTADSAASGATPAKPQEAERKPVNLFEVPEFRDFQRAVVSPMQRELQELRNRIKQAETANLDPEERLQYEYKDLQQQLEFERSERARLQTERQRETDLAALSREYGVPRAALETAESFQDAKMKAIELKYQQEIEQLRRGPQSQDDGPRYQAPQVEVGGSRLPTTRQQWEHQVAEAKQRGDTTAYYRLMMQKEPD